MAKYGAIYRMFGAQTYGTAINTLDKLVTVPLFLVFWGVNLYGEWLVLRAIPSYLGVAELGFATAAANKMSVAIVENRHDRAVSYFQAAFLVLSAVSLFVLIFFFMGLALIDIRGLLNFSAEFDYSIPLVLLSFILYVVCIFQTQLLSAAYRSVGRYTAAAYFTYNIRLFELIAVALVLILDGGVVSASAAYLAVRVSGSLLMAWNLLRSEKWIKFGFSSSSLGVIREMMPDATGFLAFPLAQAMSLQGMVFIVASVFSPVLVPLFNASRTLSRTLVQLGMQVNRSVWPELTRLYASGEIESAKKIFTMATATTLWVGGIGGVVLLLMSPFIFEIWTVGKLESDLPLMGILIFSALLNGYWFSSLSVLAATDSHKLVAFFYVIVVCVSLLAAKYLAQTSGLTGVALAVLIAELLMTIAVLRFSLMKTNIRFLAFLDELIRFPIVLLVSIKKNRNA